MKKKFTTLSLIGLFSMTSFAQTWQWAKNAVGTGVDQASSIATDASGNTFVTGHFSGNTITFGTTILTNAFSPNKDIFLAKYDVSGNVLWAKRVGGYFNDVVSSIATDASGNILIAGYFNDATIDIGSITLTNIDNSGASTDIFIAKYDALGNVLWAKSAGGSTDDRANSIASDASGNVFVAGSYSSPVIFGTETLYNSDITTTDMFLVKYTASGNVSWARGAGGSFSDGSTSVTTDVNGNILVVGFFLSNTIEFGTTLLTNADNTGSSYDMFLAKYGSSGNVLWARRDGGSNGDFANSVATDPSGNIFVAGYFVGISSINFGANILNNGVSGKAAMFLVKYDASGNDQWANMAGGIDNYANSVATDASGNITVAGYFNGNSITLGTNTLTNASTGGTADMFLAKYDASGNVLWANRSGEFNDDMANSVATAGNDNTLVAGYFSSSTTTFGTITLTKSSTYSDMFLAKYGILGCTPVALPLTEGFQNTTFPSSGWIIQNADNNVTWVRSTAVGGNGSSNASAMMDNFSSATNISGQVDNLITVPFNMSNAITPTLAFNVAYARYAASNSDTLNVYVSTNCGSTWSKIFSKGGTTLATAPDNTSLFVPTATQWRNETVNLSAYTGNASVMVSFQNKSGWGNVVYLDDISLSSSFTTGIEESTDFNSFLSISPNPSNGKFTISPQYAGEISIYNTLGEKVYYQKVLQPNGTIDISTQPNGIYLVTLNTPESLVIKRMVLSH